MDTDTPQLAISRVFDARRELVYRAISAQAVAPIIEV